MARMYSRKRGKSGSVKPENQDLSWVKYNPDEIEKLVVKLAKAGKKSAEVGILLRDSYGIPDVQKLTSKKIVQIMKENKLTGELPEDLLNLIKKETKLASHIEKNHKDMPAKRGLLITESKIKKLVKYYKRTKVLPKDWKYTREQAKLLIR